MSSTYYIVGFALALFFICYVAQRPGKSLHRYPGPFLASITNVWRALDVYGRNTHITYRKLHARYGDVVRVAPNVLSFGNPSAIQDIYGLQKGFTKSGYYDVFATLNRGNIIYNLFSTRSEAYHARLRRSVNHAFALSTLLDFEPLVDSCTSYWLQRTEEIYVKEQRLCPLSTWVQYFAFDVIGELTWSKRLGFVEENRDVADIIGTVDSFQNYGTIVGQNPWWDTLLVKNPIKRFLESKNLWPASPNAAIIQFALARKQEASASLRSGGSLHTPGPKGINFLQRFLQSQDRNPDFLTDDRITAMCASLIIAGSDSTAISLSGVFYYLLKNPRVYSKLMAEIDAASAAGALAPSPNSTGADDVVSFPAANKLKYLDAVITESFRMHPAAGLLLERVTPPQGATIEGHFVPGGVVVGCNAWVLHQNKEVFGEDADVFRPERWLEGEGVDPLKIGKMRSSMFQFGAGSRTCIGKNISLMETYKMVPSFLRKFEIELDESNGSSYLKNAFFVHRKNFNVRIKLRKTESVRSLG
ncbi:putative cytochrome P450 [Didymella exigua CBS 183.55]|uniref:Putative cytochrome P450 n=1 Tax=Didymella exigua CBS 183.55 TaxID=1150837 RepID=A0A6A5R3N5_9PLEO|nr:putative cytochrome P450 [Didymella exigua CBS 183.55]KAF1922262.1 putative cytochrome P450 [Didymella exigua CBS 183.55]